MASLRNSLLALCAGAAVVLADDHLVSRRHLSKRFIDEDGNYNMSIIHVNDVHSHFVEFTSSGTDCTDKAKGCRGGVARISAMATKLREQHPDSLFLNAGDESQGTLFYTYYGAEKIAETLNYMKVDCFVPGNHEFDKGDDHLGDFLENLTFPVISANIVSDHPKLNKTIKPFFIYEQYELAVIGVTTESTPSISKPGNGTKFTNAVQAVQDTVDHIKSTTNIKRIVAVTHIGFQDDRALAKATTGIGMIVGGHSHTLLGNFSKTEGGYPTIEKSKDGDEVFIVTNWRWGENIGYIDVTWDADGKVVNYNGGPIPLSNLTAQDSELQAKVDEWGKPFEEFGAEVVGSSAVELDQSICQQKECLMGNLIADAMFEYRKNGSTPEEAPDFALMNAGGIRASIDDGPVTRKEVLTCFPFSNAVVEAVLTGDFVWKTVEGIVSDKNQQSGATIPTFLQVSSGTEIRYNPAAAVGSRLVSISINGAPLDKAKEYRVVTVDFLATGGDNVYSPVLGALPVLDTLDEVLVQYLAARSPVTVEIEGRIKEVSCSSKKHRRGTREKGL
ncbi:Metallo-dependent phosphatase-like protein [Coniochaeta sp. 2T2.1]|nr:Metallo-dependent phosphatase-like protein [Coniochaeta sp. 2T2.1]